MTHNTAFTTGPFLSASHMLEDFAVGIYFSYLLEEAVSEQMLLEKKLKEAIAAKDEDKIAQLQIDLLMIESAYQLSSFAEDENNH